MISAAAPRLHTWIKDYRLTLGLAVTALVVILVGTYVVNNFIGSLATENLAKAGEQQASRDALHIDSMIIENQSMLGIDRNTTIGQFLSMTDKPLRQPISLELLVAPLGLDASYHTITHGLNIEQFTLFDLNGMVVWSNGALTPGDKTSDFELFRSALVNGVTSSYVPRTGTGSSDSTDGRSKGDLVETYFPLRNQRSGQVMGINEV